MKRVSSLSESTLPSYLTGTLLLRGKTRLYWSAGLMVFLAVGGAILQNTVGHSSNAIVAVVVFALAWMWGRVTGALVGFAGTLANDYWVGLMGLPRPESASTHADALAIAAIAVLIGHIGRQLERALGERAKSDIAYSKLEETARDRMLTITDQVPVGLYRTTPDGRIVGGNDALMSILGFTDRDTMLRTNVWDHYVRTEDRQQGAATTGSAAAGEWREFELVRADGTTLWVRDWARAVLDDDGEAVYWDGVIQDVSDQRQATERFRAAFDESPIGMTISNADGFLLRGNAALADLMGRSREELADLHFSEYSFEEEVGLTNKALLDVRTGDAVTYEKRLKRPDGSFVWALISIAPVHHSGEAQLVITHVVNITERKAAKDALEELVRSKDELIASVSHELRTPLTVVHGLAQELDTGWMSFSVPEQKEFIALIAQQSAEVAHIVEDLLVAARADIGKLPIYGTSVDVRTQLESALTAVPESDVSVEVVGDVSPVAFADGTRVRQILRNLLVNAKRYGGASVVARHGVVGSVVFVEILDDGDGIPHESAETIFEPYSRAHNQAGQPSSVGLGLTVSRKLAELMGGNLTYEFEGGWSCFRLELPLAGSVAAVAASNEEGSG